MPDNLEIKRVPQPEPVPDDLNTLAGAEKMPEHEAMAKSAQQLADMAAEMDKDRGVSVWLYGFALILLLFIMALIFLTMVASSPTTR